jgi:cell division protein FtsI/penicillin-binding protein 2
MRWNAQARAVTVCFGLVGIFSVYSFRLIYLQVVEHDEYAAVAAQKQTRKQPTYAKRGIIRDIHNEPLATNLPVRTVIADPSHIRDPMAVAQAIANQLEMDPREIADKIAKGGKYVKLKDDVPEDKAQQLMANLRTANLRGIDCDPNFIRVYPNGTMLSQVIGFLDHDHRGVMGIEKTMQDFLQGTNGYRYITHDRKGQELTPYRGLEQPAKNGCDVTLTVDLGLQNIVDEELDLSFGQYHPDAMMAIMMRPETGEILAMSSRPTFDLNDPGKAKPVEQRNDAIVYMFEPGSVFKIVATSAAVQEKLVTPDTPIYCENSHFVYAGKVLHDDHPNGVLTVHQILVKSSNIGVAKLAIQLGENRFYQYIKKFGFGDKTGIALTGEISGLVNPLHRWSKLDITRIPMGQSIAVTPLQMITAMSAIANGGRLMRPLILSKITGPDGRVVADYPPQMIRQAVSRETSKKIVSALKDVFKKGGTMQSVSIPGYDVAGKTGTAYKLDPKEGYMMGRYVVSVCGFLPADNPKFVLYVVVDNPNIPRAFGATVAGPIFGKIAERAAHYLDLQPTQPTPEQLAKGKKNDRDTAGANL